QAAGDLHAVQQRLGDRYPETDRGWTVSVVPLKVLIVGNVQANLWMLFGAGLLILLVASANVGCLFLAEVPGRAVEMRTRVALGATRPAILRQLLAEAAGHVAVGSAVGLILAAMALPVLRSQLPDVPRIAELRLDPGMVAI